ncbi:MAG: MoaD/ThiS family protein [Chloroflexi bacterium]|nr:MoaD/ThiS family protein [Chloroflexota bacterium]
MASVTVKFNGMWRLYVGAGTATLQAGVIEEALKQIEKEFAPKFEKKLQERGVKLDGGILKLSYITLNRKNIKELAERTLKDGDILDLFVAVPGG